MSSLRMAPAPSFPNPGERVRIGMLWGDFPWERPAPQVGKLLSMGAVARNVTRCLNRLATVIPYAPPSPGVGPEDRDASLARFLGSIDLLWADVYPASAPALRLRRELDLPCPALLFAGGAMPKGAEAMLFPWRHLLTPADHLIFTCAADRRIWQRLVRASALGEWVVPLGVDDTVFHPRSEAERAKVRAQYRVPENAPLLLYVGRLNIQKNLHLLLHLFAAVRAELPGARLCLAGGEDDIVLGEFRVSNTGYVAWLHRLAAALGVADGVTYTGVLLGEELARLYAAADVVVNLSVYHRENFGMAQAEAQACGVPVVCTAWGGFKEVVRSGETGYAVDAVMTAHGIRVDWRTAVRHVLRLLRDPTLRAAMGAQAGVWARERFSMAALTRSLEPVVVRAAGAELPAATAPAYRPSVFARRYEAHKRACGWYADGDDSPHWYPPMFQGLDYELYKTLFEPYATYRAESLSPDAIQSGWVPYPSIGLQMDPVRREVREPDPIWPHRFFPRPLEWEVLQRTDGVATVGTIVESLAGDGWDETEVLVAFWRLHVEGVLLFQSYLESVPGEQVHRHGQSPVYRP